MSNRREAWRGFDGVNRRKFLQYGAIALGTSIATACTGQTSQSESPAASSEASPEAAATPTPGPVAGELKKVIYGTNWYAQAEHGGFYQAVATGIYKEHGLDVTVKMGGPQVNGTQLLVGGAIDFFMGYASSAIKAVEEGIPTITVASMFQKDPQILMTHPQANAKDLADLKGKPIYISQAARFSYWPFLRAKYGFTDDQIRPYNFNPGPFLSDKTTAQQGYLSSEPLAIEKEGGFKPTVFLLADYGYTPYSTTIECTRELVEKDPDLVQRFTDATIKGWYSYLYGDPAPANELIKKDNPEMTDEQISYSIEKMKEYGIVDSLEAKTLGIGAMTDERWKAFFDTMAAEGVFKKDTDYKQAYTLQFINKGPEAYKV